MKRTFRGKFIGGGGSNGCEGKKGCLLWVASTAANVTKASFKSSTANNFIGLWTIWEKQQGNGGDFSQFGRVISGHPVYIYV